MNNWVKRTLITTGGIVLVSTLGLLVWRFSTPPQEQVPDTFNPDWILQAVPFEDSQGNQRQFVITQEGGSFEGDAIAVITDNRLSKASAKSVFRDSDIAADLAFAEVSIFREDEEVFIRVKLLNRDYLPNEFLISEAEFSKANEVARSQSTALEARREELSSWLEEQRTRVSTAERLPGAIQSFLTDFESLDVRHQKAQLQAILKSALRFPG